jgi:uncharacterized protein YndB with AHSA1/START domain
MTTGKQDVAVRAEIEVDVPVEHAFAAFTDRTVTWKPPEHNLLGVAIAETIFEAHEGGYLLDRGVDGSECRWARVLAFEPPTRVVLSWLISPRWEIEADGAQMSEVEVRFIAETPDRTRVEIDHRHLDRHGDGWEALRDAVRAPEGWPLYLQRFGDAISA